MCCSICTVAWCSLHQFRFYTATHRVHTDCVCLHGILAFLWLVLLLQFSVVPFSKTEVYLTECCQNVCYVHVRYLLDYWLFILTGFTSTLVQELMEGKLE